MDWIGSLRGNVVALGTAPLICFIERHPSYLALVRPFFQALDRGEFRVVTSTMTLVGVLVHPFRSKNTVLAQQYRDLLLNVSGLTTVPLSPPIAEAAARLRATHNLRPPDAVQLATAVSTGAAAFLTNDTRLPRLDTLPLLVLDELQPQTASE